MSNENKKIADYSNSSLAELEETLYLISEPTRFFEIGDKIFIANNNDTEGVVISISEDKKLYQIEFLSVSTHRGEVIKEMTRKFFPWHKINNKKPSELSLFKKDILDLHYSQMSVNSLIVRVFDFGVDFNPDYQRDHVWDLEDKVALIDAIFHNADIGKFSFLENDNKTYSKNGFSFEVVDGKQRLTAIKEFFEGKFSYKGLTYHEMNEYDRRHFRSHPVAVGDIKNATKLEIMQHFVRINAFGKVMDKNHLDRVYKMIEEYTA